jgi:hypothetical protein
MSDPPKKKRRFRIGCLGICVCIFFAFVFMCAGIKLYIMHALESELDALRAAGEPVTWEEVLAGMEPIPDEENSALVLEAHKADILRWWESPAANFVHWCYTPDFAIRPSAEMLDALRKCMSENAVALSAIHDAARRTQGRWPDEPSSSVSLRTGGRRPGAEVVALATRLLTAENGLHAAEGNGESAARTLLAVMRISRSLDDNADLANAFVQFKCAWAAFAGTEHALSLTTLSAQDLAILRGELAASAEKLSLSTCARAQRATVLVYASDPTARRAFLAEQKSLRSFRFPSPLAVTEDSKWREIRSFLPGSTESDALCLLRFMNKLVTICDLPLREQSAAFRTLESEVKANPISKHDPRWVTWLASNNLGEGFQHASVQFVLATQIRGVASAALATEQFRIERGRWPRELAELVPDYLDAVPHDLFASAGTTIRYYITPTGVRLGFQRRHGLAGLSGKEKNAMRVLGLDIDQFKAANGRLPKTLEELVPGQRDAVPLDPRTGKPWTYRTNPANAELFILGEFTDGKSEAEFWAQTLTSATLAEKFKGFDSSVFRLLNPELRGATQNRFCKEVGNLPRSMKELGYTPERLKQLGFSKAQIDRFESELEDFEEEEALDRGNDVLQEDDEP